MQRFLRCLGLLGSCLFLSTPLLAADVNVTADITTNTTWTADNVYFMDGLIFVHSGATLTIEPGTVIKARLQANITTGDGASALVVRRGAMINASGTLAQPIIFTSELDDVTNPNDLIFSDRGLWGGVIILGAATTNQPTTDNQIEGIPSTEEALYGGTNDADNSGTFRYVSIRHSGFSISGVPGDEIQGLTLGAVGNGTTIEYVESYASADDGFEFFGGTVNTKYLVSAFCADDAFDYDQGFRGNHQYWFAIQGPDESGRAGEHDGGDDDKTGAPFSMPVIANATYIGSGMTATPGGDGNDVTFKIRDNAGGKYFNSIFTDFPGDAFDVEDRSDRADSRDRLDAGDLIFSTNIFSDYGGGTTFGDLANSFMVDHLNNNGNEIVSPDLGAICRTEGGACLDPRPNANSPALMGAIELDDGFFDTTDYRGAFRGSNYWIQNWTALAAQGFLGDISTPNEDTPELPTDVALDQNYPNPFNPTTVIQYHLPEAGPVRLQVYDILGQEVMTLMDGVQAAGVHQARFTATDLVSGLYLYRLTFGQTILTKKMLVVK